MNGGQLPTNQLHDIDWGAFDHASRVCVRESAYLCVERIHLYIPTCNSNYIYEPSFEFSKLSVEVLCGCLYGYGTI